MLAVVIGGIFYYLQIGSNEANQNRLHFQELKLVQSELDGTLVQINNFAKDINKNREMNKWFVYLKAYRKLKKDKVTKGSIGNRYPKSLRTKISQVVSFFDVEDQRNLIMMCYKGNRSRNSNADLTLGCEFFHKFGSEFDAYLQIVRMADVATMKKRKEGFEKYVAGLESLVESAINDNESLINTEKTLSSFQIESVERQTKLLKKILMGKGGREGESVNLLKIMKSIVEEIDGLVRKKLSSVDELRFKYWNFDLTEMSESHVENIEKTLECIDNIKNDTLEGADSSLENECVYDNYFKIEIERLVSEYTLFVGDMVPVIRNAKVELKDKRKLFNYISCKANSQCVRKPLFGSVKGNDLAELYWKRKLIIVSDLSSVEIPASDLINHELNHFPKVVLVDKEGDVLLEKNKASLDVYQGALSMRNIKAHIDKTNRAEGEKASLNMSGFTDAVYGGINYRFFMMPLTIDKTELYLVGIKPVADISLARLYFSPSIGLLLVFIMILILCVIPLLKIRFIFQHYAFTQYDVWSAVGGLVLMVGTVSIAYTDFALYSQTKQQQVKQSESIFKGLKAKFKEEVKAVNEFMNKNRNKISGSDSELYEVQEIESQKDKPYSIQQMFVISSLGKTENKWVVANTNRSYQVGIDLSHRAYFKSTINCIAWDMSDNGSKKEYEACDKQIFIERILNVTDGRKTTQFAKPMYEKANMAFGDRTVSSASTILQSFMLPVLPRNFGYMVFENKSGNVLYHDNDKLSLVENAYTSTDNNNFLYSIVKQSAYIKEPKEFIGNYKGKEHHFVAGPLSKTVPWTLVVYYKKEELQLYNFLLGISSLLFYLLFVTSLVLIAKFVLSHSRLSKFLVYQERQKPELYKRMTLFLLLLCGTYSLFSFLVADLGYKVIFWFALLLIYLFVDNRSAVNHSSEREPRKKNSINQHSSYNAYVFLLLIFVAILPSISFTLASFNYFMDKAAIMETMHYNSSMSKSLFTRADYNRLIKVKKSEERLKPFSFINIIKERNIESDADKSIFRCKGSLVWRLCSSAKQAVDADSKSGFSRISQQSKIQPKEESISNNDPILNGFMKLTRVDLAIPSMLNILSQKLSAEKSQASENFITANTSQITKRIITENPLQLIVFLGLFSWIIMSVIRNLLLGRVLGGDLSGYYREKEIPNDKYLEPALDKLISDSYKCHYFMLLRPSRMNIGKQLERLSGRIISDKPIDLCELIRINHQVEVNENREKPLDRTSYVEKCGHFDWCSLLEKVKGKEQNVVVFSNINSIMFNKAYRVSALNLLENIINERRLSVLLITDVSPLYRLTRQESYPDVDETDLASAEEKLKWSSLLSRFDKYFDWYPKENLNKNIGNGLKTTILRECESWPEQQKLEEIFCRFHVQHKISVHSPIWAAKYRKGGYDYTFKKLDELLSKPDKVYEIKLNKSESKYSINLEELEKTKFTSNTFNDSLKHCWTSSQINEFFVEKAGAIFRYRWELCTKQERLLLFYIACGRIANPQNHEALEHLIRRGYLVNRGIWSINSKSFKHFILSAEPESKIKEWQEEFKDSYWTFIRIPIFAVIFMLVVIIIYSATDAYESIFGLISALLAMVPLLLRNFSLFRGVNS